MKSPSDIVIFGASHVGVRLAERLVERGHRLSMIDPAPGPETAGWPCVRTEYAVPDDIGDARLVYVVTDTDKLNIRLALAIRHVSRTVPIVIALTESRLGEKLARHLAHFQFVNPPELAAARFVAALDEARPGGSGLFALPAVVFEPRNWFRWRPDRLVLRAVGAICALGVCATVYFHFAENMRWIDAAYFVVTMMATVGFGDFSLREASTLSKLVGIVVMIASVTNTAVIFALVTDSLLKKRLLLSFGRRHIRLRDHIVVAGVGSVGLRVVEKLRERDETVVVVDNQENCRHLPAIYAKGIPTIIGDARLERTLADAGLARAKAMLCVTNDDLTNLEVGLNARLLNHDCRLVLRIYDQELAHSLREQLDIHFAFSMSAVAAEALAKFAGAAPTPHGSARAASAPPTASAPSP